MKFSKAQRKKAKLRTALAGPAGSGKTWGALEIAKGLGGRIAVIDTERGSASLYSENTEFDTLELNPPFTPERYIEAIKSAEKAGYDVLIIDSITHEWNGSGGCLEINETVAHSKFRGNTWAAWNETTPRHRAFIDAILQSPMHVIATIRTKTDTVQNEGNNGKKQVVKVGMKEEQRDGTEYEFTLMFSIDHNTHIAIASKDRTNLFPEPHKISIETGQRLAEWLDSGVELPPEPKAIDKHAKTIKEADSLEILKAAFFAATHDKKLTQDERNQLVTLKDQRKAELDPSGAMNGNAQNTEALRG